MGAETCPRQTFQRSPAPASHHGVRTKEHLRSPACLDPAAQPAFLLGVFLWPPSAYFCPDSNNQVLEELSEESTVFFVSVAYILFLTALSLQKAKHQVW